MRVTYHRTLEDAYKAGDWYAVNNSTRNNTQTMGQLLFPVTTEDGSSVDISIPPTWIPIDLQQFASPDDLRKCSGLRSLLTNKLIILLDKASKTAMENSPNYKAERVRVTSFEKKRDRLDFGDGTDEMEISIPGGSALIDTDPSIPSINRGGKADTTNSIDDPAGETMAQRIRNTALDSLIKDSASRDVRLIVTGLESLRPYQPTDFGYLLAHIKDNSNPLLQIVLEIQDIAMDPTFKLDQSPTVSAFLNA